MATTQELVQIAQGSIINLTQGAGGITVNSVILPITDCRAYKHLKFAIAGAAVGNGEIQVQQSTDIAFPSFTTVTPRRLDRTYSAPITVSPTGFYEVLVRFPFVRIIVSRAYTSGSLTVPTTGIWGSTADLSPDYTQPKLQLVGFPSTASANTNLLDPTGTGAWLDVSQYQSGKLLVVSTATTGSYTVQGAFDATPTGLETLQLSEATTQSQNQINAAITPTATTRIFLLNLQGVNQLRANLTTGAVGIQMYLVLNQAPMVPNQFNVQQATAANMQVTAAIASTQTLATVTTVGTVTTVASNQLASQSVLNVDVASTALTTVGLTTSAVVTPLWGVSAIFSVVVTAVTGTTPTMDIIVQESPDSGTTWNNIYAFPTITTAGTFNSPLIAQAGKQYRYAQTLAGTTPSFTRAINRFQSNVFVPPYAGVARLGGINPVGSDFAVGARFVRRIFASNTTATQLFLQFFNKTSVLVNADIPIAGEIYEISAISGVAAGILNLTPANLPPNGLNYGGNTRVGISSTRNTYTAATMTGVNLLIEVTA
jgi:hypothetical protein